MASKNKKGNKKAQGNNKQHQKSKMTNQQTQTTSKQSPAVSTKPAAQQDESRPVVNYTNTNTDKVCLDTSKPGIFRHFYRYNLWTGLYMLNPNEQLGFNIFGWLFAICITLYMYVFLRGFRDGLAADAFEDAAAVSI